MLCQLWISLQWLLDFCPHGRHLRNEVTDHRFPNSAISGDVIWYKQCDVWSNTVCITYHVTSPHFRNTSSVIRCYKSRQASSAFESLLKRNLFPGLFSCRVMKKIRRLGKLLNFLDAAPRKFKSLLSTEFSAKVAIYSTTRLKSLTWEL